MQNLITSATFGGDSVLTAVCTSLCLLVKRITQKLWVDFSEIWGKVDYLPEKRWLKFWKWCGRFPGYLGYRKFISNSVRAAAKIFIWRITFPFTSFPSLLSAPFLLEVGLLIQLRGLGERCKLFQRVRAEPDRQRFLVIFWAKYEAPAEVYVNSVFTISINWPVLNENDK